MSDNDSELYAGSVDRSKLDEMKAAAGDDLARQAQVAEVQAQVDAVAESDAAAEKARQDALAAQTPQAEAEAQEPEAEATEVESVEGGSQYDNLSKAELQDELASRGLATTGNKDELAARLEEDDGD
jgi:FKBP-type peptidyl-prolyl cis-trans isomerase